VFICHAQWSYSHYVYSCSGTVRRASTCGVHLVETRHQTALRFQKGKPRRHVARWAELVACWLVGAPLHSRTLYSFSEKAVLTQLHRFNREQQSKKGVRGYFALFCLTRLLCILICINPLTNSRGMHCALPGGAARLRRLERALLAAGLVSCPAPPAACPPPPPAATASR
jgi:hypothetical protein